MKTQLVWMIADKLAEILPRVQSNESEGSRGTVALASSYTQIYRGRAGIALFLLYAYELSRNYRYLEATRICLEDIWRSRARTSESLSAQFLTGDVGLAYCFAELGRVAGDANCQDVALEIALKAGARITRYDMRPEYINGMAGTLMGLSRVAIGSSNAELISLIGKGTEFLIGETRFSKFGVYWDVCPRRSRGTTGFSHGNAGVAASLIELYRAFGCSCEELLLLARWAFDHERAYYRGDLGSWAVRHPDGENDQQLQDEQARFYSKRLPHALGYYGWQNLWCHGATGGAFARLSFICRKLFPETQNELVGALDATYADLIRDTWGTLSLCHGLGGGYLLLAEATKRNVCGYENCHDLFLEMIAKRNPSIESIVSRMTEFADPNDIGLFNGIAGLGYCLLFPGLSLGHSNILFPQFSGLGKIDPRYAWCTGYFSKSIDRLTFSVPCVQRGSSAEKSAAVTVKQMTKMKREMTSRKYIDRQHFILPKRIYANSTNLALKYAAHRYEAAIIDESLIAAQYKIVVEESSAGFGTEAKTNPSIFLFQGIDGLRGIARYQNGRVHTQWIGLLCYLLLEAFIEPRALLCPKICDEIRERMHFNKFADTAVLTMQISELVKAGLLVHPRHYSLIYK